MKITTLELTNLYFNAFKTKDLDLLRDLYSEDVILIDWTGQWYGKDSVLLANKQLFDVDFDLSVDESVSIELKSYNNIHIRFEQGPIDVLDILTFDENNKLIKIRAYKG